MYSGLSWDLKHVLRDCVMIKLCSASLREYFHPGERKTSARRASGCFNHTYILKNTCLPFRTQKTVGSKIRTISLTQNTNRKCWQEGEEQGKCPAASERSVTRREEALVSECFLSLWFWFWFCCPHTDSLSRIRSISSWHREQHKVQKRLDDLSTWPSAPEQPASPWSCWSGPGGSACTRWFSSWSVWACPGNSSSRLWPSPAGTVKNRTVGSVQTRNILLGLWPFLQTETETEPSQQAARQGLWSEHAGKQTLLGWHIDQ